MDEWIAISYDLAMETSRINLYDLSQTELEALFKEWGEPAYRARQVWRHLYVNLVDQPSAMTDLSKSLREKLEVNTSIGNLRTVKRLVGDNEMTRKILLALPDDAPVETVLMMYPDRATVCVSSQSGCPMQCVFCATGKLGFLHDLTPGQIIEQVLWAAREIKQANASPLTNIVFMGMGEPFNNYDAWWTAVERLHDPQGFNMGARNFTVSTVGLIPGIQRLAEEKLPINLAISLHAADDTLRSEMMPVNKRYPIADLIEAARAYAEKTHRRVSFEYVLLKEKNDFPEQALLLAKLLRPPGRNMLLCHVNLSPWNPVPGTPLGRSDRKRVLDFQAVLQRQDIPCTVRVERGIDIGAACGQLAGA